jgi:hypothetical protein
MHKNVANNTTVCPKPFGNTTYFIEYRMLCVQTSEVPQYGILYALAS